MTPLGADAETFWQAARRGPTPVSGPSASFDASRVPLAGSPARCPTSTRRSCSTARRSGATTGRPRWRSSRHAPAMDMAGLPGTAGRGRTRSHTGVVIGSGLGGTGTLIDQISVNAMRGPDRVSPFFIPMAIGNMAAGQVAISFNAKGPNFSTTSACASAGHAIGEAAEMILRGDAEACLGGRCRGDGLRGDARRVRGDARPVDTQRRPGRRQPPVRLRPRWVRARGGRCDADARGAGARTRRAAPASSRSCVGYAASADASHITSPAPGGEGALRAARRALAQGGHRRVTRSTSCPPTPRARRRVTWRSWRPSGRCSGERAPKVPVTAIKSAIGHTLGAAGAIAMVAMHPWRCATASVPPTLNLTDPTRRGRHGPDAAGGARPRGPGGARQRIRVRRPELGHRHPALGRGVTDGPGAPSRSRRTRKPRQPARPGRRDSSRSSTGSSRCSRHPASTSWRSSAGGTTLVLRTPVASPVPVDRGGRLAPAPPPAAPVAPAAPARAPVHATTERACASVVAPLTGVFYLSPSPGAAAVRQGRRRGDRRTGHRAARGDEAVQRDQERRDGRRAPHRRGAAARWSRPARCSSRWSRREPATQRPHHRLGRVCAAERAHQRRPVVASWTPPTSGSRAAPASVSGASRRPRDDRHHGRHRGRARHRGRRPRAGRHRPHRPRHAHARPPHARHGGAGQGGARQ